MCRNRLIASIVVQFTCIPYGSRNKTARVCLQSVSRQILAIAALASWFLKVKRSLFLIEAKFSSNLHKFLEPTWVGLDENVVVECRIDLKRTTSGPFANAVIWGSEKKPECTVSPFSPDGAIARTREGIDVHELRWLFLSAVVYACR